MKLSCLPVSLYPLLTSGEMTLGSWFDLAARLGLDGADVSVAHLDELAGDSLSQLRRQAEDAGVRIAMVVTYTDFTHPEADERRRQVARLRRQINVAAEVGSTYVRVTAGQAHPGVARDEGIAWATEGLLSGLESANEAGVTLVYENHTRGYGWKHNDFSQPADIFLEIVARTEGSDLRILFDTANNLAHGDDPLPVLSQVKRRVAAVHLNDIRQAGRFEPVRLGTGAAPIVELMGMLVEEGFDGWVSVEEASQSGLDAFAPSIASADEAWVAAGGAPRFDAQSR